MLFGKKTVQKTYVDPKTAEQKTVEELTKTNGTGTIEVKDGKTPEGDDKRIILVKETEYTGVGLLGVGFLIWAGTTATCAILGAVGKLIKNAKGDDTVESGE